MVVVRLLAVFVVVLVVPVLLKAQVVEPYVIQSGSMEPTLDIGERVLIINSTFDLGWRPRTGDIVALTKPASVQQPGVHVLIKRIVGTPGQYVRTGSGGTIVVDGAVLPQAWLPAASRAMPGAAICTQNLTDCVGRTLHLPPGQYLVLGDNRANSEDGRYFGPISESRIIGPAFVSPILSHKGSSGVAVNNG
jgi:signal peptidase I